MKATSEKCIYAAYCLLLDLITTGSVGKSADSTFLSASVDDPDDAFVGFTYVAPMEEVLHEWEASARDKQIKKVLLLVCVLFDEVKIYVETEILPVLLSHGDHRTYYTRHEGRGHDVWIP